MRIRAGGALITALGLFGLLAGCAVAPIAAPKPPASVTAPVPTSPPPVPPQAEPPAPPPPAQPPANPVKWQVQGYWGPVFTDDPAGKEQKVAVLSFDDGPSAEYTARVLDTLKEHNARAIFFLNGGAGQHPDLVRRMVSEGHIVGNHTLTHENLPTLSAEEQRRQIVGVNEIIKAITGEQPYWFRAPFGAYDDETLAILDGLGMQLLNWSHGSGDWMEVQDGYKDPALLTSDVLAETPRNANMTALHPGSVILFHDTLRHTAEALPDILKGLEEKGYSFVLPEPSRS